MVNHEMELKEIPNSSQSITSLVLYHPKEIWCLLIQRLMRAKINGLVDYFWQIATTNDYG